MTFNWWPWTLAFLGALIQREGRLPEERRQRLQVTLTNVLRKHPQGKLDGQLRNWEISLVAESLIGLACALAAR
jgi:hypothetical protein